MSRKSYFHLNIKYLRTKKKISQKELGQMLNVTYSTISGYENENGQPTLDKFLKLADIFEVNLEELVYRDIANEGINARRNLTKDEQSQIFDQKSNQLSPAAKKAILEFLKTQ